MSGLSIARPVDSIGLLLTHKAYFWHLGSLLLLGDVFLTQLIIRFVPYTEIDYSTYLDHMKVYESGVRDYTQITGPSGPLVYPAGHVMIHRLLYAATVTSQGVNIALSQQIYGVIYILCLLLVMVVYRQAGGVPNYALIPLVLSKRVHSIYVLRLFNDCWSIVALLGAIIAYNRRKNLLGSVLFSAALSIKMNIVLYLPGLLVVLVQSVGVLSTIGNLAVILLFQAVVALPFLATYPKSYLACAFDLSRVFLYKWTVNWRFVPEDIFYSKEFSYLLLAGHIFTLVLFGVRWCSRDGGVFKVIGRALRRLSLPAGMSLLQTLPDQITTILFTSNLIGVLFARSLHYQFYSWYAFQLPFLAWRTTYPLSVKIGILIGVEYAWNVFPSTNTSSYVLLFCHSLLLAGVYFGFPEGKVDIKPRKEK